MSRGENVKVKHPVVLPATLRQTLLTTFDACQFAGYLSVLTDGSEPSHPLFRGRAFHDTVDRCTKAMIANGEIEIAPDDAKAVMLEVLREHPEWVIPARFLDELRVLVHRWATFFRLPGPHCVSEAAFRMPVGDQTVTGTVDLLWREGDTVHIRDYKAGWLVYTQADVSGNDEGRKRGARAAQLITYALLVADGEAREPLPFSMAGVNFFDCRFVFPMAGGDEGMLERYVTISRPELIEHREWLHGNVARMVNRFEAQSFTAVAGSHCSRCPEPASCPLKHHTSAAGPFERPVTEVAEDWLFMDLDAKRLKKELRVWVEQNGPVPVGVDQELAIVATASGTRFDVRKRAA